MRHPKHGNKSAPTWIEIKPTGGVRYIKLGHRGSWEKDCVARGILRIGFGTAQPERFRMCRARRWDDLAESFKQQDKSKGTVTSFTNQVRRFFEDDGSTLWITFVGERLYWGVVDQSQPQRDAEGAYRSILHGWRCTDQHGEPLTKDRLSGALTKLAAYQGTSCDVKDAADYVVRRINGQKVPQVERAIVASAVMKSSALDLMRLLTPRDFETLVDLVFSTSGWRRVGIVGGTEKTRDLDLVLPSTDERAFVQVKSKTSSAELTEYVAKIVDGPYDRMFYVYHTGKAETKDERVTVIHPERLAEMVFDAGLVSWLIRKVS